MPVSLGVPEVIVGNITSGQVVLRDIQFVPTTQIKAGTSNGPEPLAIAPGSETINPTINLNTPVMADERLVLFNRSTNSYITTTPILGKEALSKYPNIEFVGSFDSRTANLVAKELAANPPSSVSAQIMDMAGKTDIGENMQFLAILNAIVTAMGTRGQILKDLLDSGELTTVPDIQTQWNMAANINNFETVYQPPVSEFVIQTPPVRTTLALGEEAPPQPVRTTMALGEESPPQSSANISRREKLVEDLLDADRIMDASYCSNNMGIAYRGPNDVNIYYIAGGRGKPASNETCRLAAQSRGDDFGSRNAIVISREDYKAGLRRQIAELDAESTAEPINWWSTPNMPGSFVNPIVSGSPRPPWDTNVNPPMQLPMPSNCKPVPPGVPPVPAGCVPVRPPIPPPKVYEPYYPPPPPPPPPDEYDDSGDGVGSV